MSLRPPAGLSADIEHTRAIRRLLGDHVDVIERIRSEAQRQPIEHNEVQSWLDELGVPPELRPEHAIWQRDFDAYYFNELRDRATTWFLFRQELLFVLPTAIVSELPKPGHAYVFAKPAALDSFTTAYSKTTRDEIRRNRGKKAIDPGFVGRVVRGRQKKRWLSALLRLVG